MSILRIRNIALGLFLLAFAIAQFTNVEIAPVVVAVFAAIAGLLYLFVNAD